MMSEQEPIGPTPMELLWQFLAERCGQELAEEAHRYFNEQQRIYQKRWRERSLQPFKKEGNHS